MCYVHPIHPTLCKHNYYLLLAICGPNASLRTCPSSSLIVTGPPGWDGRPRAIQNGLCPRCDLGSEGVDLSRVRFYKPAKTGQRKRHRPWKRSESESPYGPRSSAESDGSQHGWAKESSNVTARSPQPRKVYPCAPSAQSLPAPSSRYGGSSHTNVGRYPASDMEYSSDTDGEANGPSTTHSHLKQARDWWRRRVPRVPRTVQAQGEDDGRGRRRDRIKTVIKGSLVAPLKGMVEGITSRSRSRHSSAEERPPWGESASGRKPRGFRSAGPGRGEGHQEGSMVWSYGT